MNSEFFEALNLLEKEKGIPKEFMLEKLQAALTSAYRHESGNPNCIIKVEINESKRDLKVYSVKKVVADAIVPFDPTTQIKISDTRTLKRKKKYQVGDDVLEELKTKDFGRLSAQNAKQVIIQGIREFEKNKAKMEYENKKESIISGEVVRINDDGSVIIDTGNGHVNLPVEEQIPNEEYTIGKRMKFYIAKINQDTKGPLVSLSRTHKKLLTRLLENEVPELQDGSIVIRNVVREPGNRAKIAVEARKQNIDPIGSCIGNGGIRILQVSKELNGEKIDVIPYSDYPEKYVKAALSPASILSVEKVEEKVFKVTVAKDQYTLAIGKEGQNVRLAAKLTGLKIDIKQQ